MRETWWDQVKDVLSLGRKMHADRNWLGIAIFWVFALVMTVALVVVGLTAYGRFA